MNSDRMGLRLEGGEILPANPRELVSEAVAPGTIQLPPSGAPVVLLGDCQTIGGYPKIAHVITVDLGHAAQLQPLDEVRFELIELEEARALLRERERERGTFPCRVGGPFRMKVDLNSDLGEGAGHDDEILSLVSSANIACGFHAGNPASIFNSIRAAKEKGVAVGAHPSLDDRKDFGRTEMQVSAAEVYALVAYQVGRI